jgi:23S rRNA (uracil1939-C5)-methyltransferase
VSEIELRIDSLAAGGEGVGRAPDGLVVFVPQTAPGDRVRVRLAGPADARRRRRHARGALLELLEAGPDRAPAPCPVFGECGGCAWQHVAYPAQLAAKARILRDALERIGGLSLPELPGITPSPQPYGYRARARLRSAGGRVGYRRRGSHELCAVTRCAVLLPRLEQELARLAGKGLPDGQWELAAGRDAVRVAPVHVREGRARPDSRAGGPHPQDACASARLELEVAGERIGFSAGVFAQANALLLETLCARVLSQAGAGGLALELFAGAGLFTLPLARRFERVVAVEGNALAAADLRRNLARAGLANVEVRAEPAEDLRPEGLAPDVALLDPPRAGAARPLLQTLARLAPRVVYLSCDPATLARDVRQLVALGLALRRVEGFDLFPQTPHVEALAVLERE